jgi:hypothetical protein
VVEEEAIKSKKQNQYPIAISIYLSGFFNSCRRLPETKRHSPTAITNKNNQPG